MCGLDPPEPVARDERGRRLRSRRCPDLSRPGAELDVGLEATRGIEVVALDPATGEHPQHLPDAREVVGRTVDRAPRLCAQRVDHVEPTRAPQCDKPAGA